MKKLTFAFYLLFQLFGYTQTDTVRIDLHEMSIDLRTCECLLFSNCRQLSYPAPANWKRADSLFIGNQDTIYFTLSDSGKVKIAGYKTPSGNAFGEIQFYNNKSELIKIEFTEEVSLIRGDAEVSWSDGWYWSKQYLYKKNVVTKETSRSIIYDDQKGFAQKTTITHYKRGIKKRTNVTYRYL
jgi:hypothetical protein